MNSVALVEKYKICDVKFYELSVDNKLNKKMHINTLEKYQIRCYNVNVLGIKSF